jgi:prolyl-tRNA editing enzyme YbaK/EbsC (Cys-tRNA(Pro) deacylase)
VFLNGVQIAQALTAGNAVVWKPSELAPASAAALHSLFLRAGYPAELIQMLDSRREMGRELAEANVDHIVFTGSSTTGQALAATLGHRLVSSSLELSGCDAMFVFDDADVDLAARAAWFGATANRGQTCIAVRRAFVQRAVYPAFLAALQPVAAGAPLLPQVLPAQVEQAERLVREAVAEGGRLLGAKPQAADGAGCIPMVVADARPEMALCREATFAPVMAVLPFDHADEAVTMDRQCPYGLGASIFTHHRKQAVELAARLRAGMVAINDVIAPTAHPATPFGGVGRSGWGVTQGAEGLLELTVPQVVSARGGSFRPHYDMSAGSGVSHGEMVRGILAFSHAATFRQRLAGLWRLGKAMWRGHGANIHEGIIMSAEIFDRLESWLLQHHIAFTVLRHEPVFTSEQAAAVRGTSLASGAKALVLKAGDGFLLAVLPADRKLDSKKAREALGVKSLRFASKEEVEQLTGLQPGSIPPFGSLFGLKTYSDPALGENESINFNAGDHSVSVQMSYADYVRVETPTMATIT